MRVQYHTLKNKMGWLKKKQIFDESNAEMQNHFGNGSMNTANCLQNRMSTKTVNTTPCEK
jgi:hypothetical protein